MVSTTDACQDQLTWIWHSLSAGHDQETLATGWRWQWWRVGCRWNPAAAAAGLLSLIVDQIFTWIKSFTVVCDTVSACYCVIITNCHWLLYHGWLRWAKNLVQAVPGRRGQKGCSLLDGLLRNGGTIPLMLSWTEGNRHSSTTWPSPWEWMFQWNSYFAEAAAVFSLLMSMMPSPKPEFNKFVCYFDSTHVSLKLCATKTTYSASQWLAVLHPTDCRWTQLWIHVIHHSPSSDDEPCWNICICCINMH